MNKANLNYNSFHNQITQNACYQCNGYKLIEINTEVFEMQKWVECPRCKGKGEEWDIGRGAEMKLNIDYNIKDGQRAIISTEDDMYGCRTLILPSDLAIEIYEALTEEWTM